MKRTLAWLLWLSLLGCRTGNDPEAGTDRPQPPTGLRLEVVDTAFMYGLLGEEPRAEVLITGMAWSEGPLVLPDGSILCSDVPNNRIMRWREGQATEWLTHSGGVEDGYSKEPGSNGLLLGPDGRLLLCQHGSRRVARLASTVENPEPRYESLATEYNGDAFNSPNDLVLAADGSILFTDPPYGLPEGAASEMGFFGVYRVDPRGGVTLLTKKYSRPNGIGLSPDGRTLYIANSDPERAIVTATPLDVDYRLGTPEVWIDATERVGSEPGLPDGLAVSRGGHVFASAPGGVWILSPAGKLLGRILTDGPVSNAALSPDETQLILTNDDRLLRIQLNRL